jgi:hypothetical protein
LTALIKIR